MTIENMGATGLSVVLENDLLIAVCPEHGRMALGRVLPPKSRWWWLRFWREPVFRLDWEAAWLDGEPPSGATMGAMQIRGADGVQAQEG